MKPAVAFVAGLFVLLLSLAGGRVEAQTMPTFNSVREFLNELEGAAANGTLNTFWAGLVAAGQVPLVLGDEVVFLYRGEAEQVEWAGDFNHWDGGADWQGERVGDTDVWLLTAEFPTDARLEYKIAVDGGDLQLDPANSRQAKSGLGVNSELVMPEYVAGDEAATPRAGVPAGHLTPPWTMDSQSLGYTVNYQVYTPANYSDLKDLPVIYVTDGQEYADPQLGALPVILDNLIADKKIKPVIAVFIDPRDPSNPDTNRRQSELIENSRYAGFIARELVPLMDAIYRTRATRDARAILGTSLGGLNAAYLGVTYPDVFGLVAMQSPAFGYSKQLLSLWTKANDLPLVAFMSNGNPEWDIAAADIDPMRAMIDAQKGVPLKYRQVNQGHAWGNWRGLLDDLLIYFFGV